MFRLLKIVALLIGLLLGLTWSATAAPPQQRPSPLTVFESMQQQAGGKLEVDWDEQTHVPRFLVGQIPTEQVAVSGAELFKAEATARAFFRNFAGLYQMQQPEAELALLKTTRDDLGMSHVRFQQEVNGVPVWGAVLVTHLDAGGQITAVNGEYVPNIALDMTPTLSLAEALAMARDDLGDPTAELFTDQSELTVFAYNHTPTLTWKVNVSSLNPLGNWLYFIDAHTGEIVHRLNQIETTNSLETNEAGHSVPIVESIPNSQEIEPLAGKSIKTYDANHTIVLPATPTCTNSDGTCPNGDTDEKAAHRYTSIVYDYFKNTFGVDSYNGNGATMEAAVHFQLEDNGARWWVEASGREYTVFSDGDGVKWGSLAQALDVVAHEWTHAFNWHQAGLIYEDQPGALQESYADVFATLIEFDADPNNANWLMFEKVWTPTIPGDALRDLSNPSNGAAGHYNPATPADYMGHGQPDHMSLYAHLPHHLNQGGVHVNSGITNKAAYLISEGGAFHGITVTGIGRNNLGRIYFRALAQYLTPTSNFMDARNATIQACTDLFGSGHSYCNSVRNGFAAVGIGAPASFNRSVYLPLVIKSGTNSSPVCSPTGIYGRVTQNGAPASGVSLELVQCDNTQDNNGNNTCIFSYRTTQTNVNGCYNFTNAETLPPPTDGVYPYSYDIRYVNPSTIYNNRLYAWYTDRLKFYHAGDSVAGGDFDIADLVLVAPAHNSSVPFPATFSWKIRNPGEIYEWQLRSPNFKLLFKIALPGGNSYTLTGSPPGVSLDPALFYPWLVVPCTTAGCGTPYYYRTVRFSQASGATTATTEETIPIPAWQVLKPEDLELWK